LAADSLCGPPRINTLERSRFGSGSGPAGNRCDLAVLLDDLPPTDVRQLREQLLAAASELSAGGDRVAWLQGLLGTELCRRLGIYRVPDDFKLSVVIPVYNEIRTLATVVERVRATNLPVEIVIVDDGSRDGTRGLLESWRTSGDRAHADLTIVLHERNQGKGGALKTGFAHCTGDVVVVQDADLEYDPRDWLALLQPILEGQADVVYGSRFSHIDGPVHHYWHRWGNQFITKLSNWKSGRALTDVETCYKLVRRELLQQIAPGLRERGFGIEIELTGKLSRLPGVRFYERPISYAGRSYREGKKIGWRDGLWALWCILRY
jgi:glycosyltransferase involved in cell wall biosynthesis